MLDLRRWQQAPALVLAAGMTYGAIAPLTMAPAMAAPVQVAQLLPSSLTTRRVAIPANTVLPVQYVATGETNKVVILPSETVDVELQISRNVRTANNQLLIPAGTKVKGKLKPANGGSRFEAEELTYFDGSRQYISATSSVIATSQEVRKGTNVGTLVKGAAVGSAAAAVIAGVTGNKKITLGKVLIGTGVGTLGSLLIGKKKTDVVVITPDSNLNLTLNSSLTVALR
jgi:hypothetical protein